MITLYGLSASGNCYKLQLACAQLGIEHAWEEIDVTRGENLSPEFLALNDRGKVPVLRLEDGRTLSESNAILNYLAQGTRLLPDDPNPPMNLGLAYRHTPALKLFAQINNLFDRRYSTAAQLGATGFDDNGNFVARPFAAVDGEYPLRHATFYAPGAPRSFVLGMRYEFGK